MSEIKISDTLLNTKITLDQDQYVFTSKYSIDIAPEKAVFKINTTSDNEKHTETINLDWEEFVEPMLNRAIKSKTELKDLAKKIQDIIEIADVAEQMAVVGISRYTIEQMLELNVKDFFQN